jgi:hypothetical protein
MREVVVARRCLRWKDSEQEKDMNIQLYLTNNNKQTLSR